MKKLKGTESTWGLSFLTLKTIYGSTYLGCVCYGAPVWTNRATIGAARRKLLQSQRLGLIFLCKPYRTVSTEAYRYLLVYFQSIWIFRAGNHERRISNATRPCKNIQIIQTAK